MQRKAVLTFVAALVALAAGVTAQGTGVQFLDFEAPAHEPIAVAEVGGQWLLLVANGPDNSVEVYDTDDLRFLFRVPVGQRPVTVAVKPALVGDARRFYVANWLGDSLTAVDLLPGPPVSFEVQRTMHVGDEPVGIAFLPENTAGPTNPLHESLLVTYSAQAGWGWFLEGSIVTDPIALHQELLVNLPGGAVHAVRDPRAVAFAPPPVDGGSYQDQMWILNFRGGNDPANYDLDLWGTDDLIDALTTDTANLPAHGGFGTTNFNMAFAPNGHLWVVGTLARNKDPLLVPNEVEAVNGEAVHLGMVTGETGFVVSFLKRLVDPLDGGATGDFLDLNDVHQTGVPGPGVIKEQARTPIAQPTDVLVYGSGAEGATRLFVTGYNSDTMGVVLPTAGDPTTWAVARIDVAHPTDPFHPDLPTAPANLDGVMRGPRALALKSPGGAVGGEGDRVYVYNRLENSVTVLDPNFILDDPASAVVRTFPLRFQVEPRHVTDGRKFLYSSKLSAGNVSCASCHIDGNTDFLAWNLSNNTVVPFPTDPGAPPGILGPNAPVKGPMVTQPLRGLVNFEVEKDDVQDLYFSNKPYHWRGDRGFFDQFNGAFVVLMGIPLPLESEPPKGIPDEAMHQYREFAFAIHYPPNPNQLWTREYRDLTTGVGSPTEGAPPGETGAPTGARLGLELFHTIPCVTCHNLPEGSNNQLTDSFFYSDPATGFELNQIANALETAQVKGLVLKEKRLRRIDPVSGLAVEVPSTGAATTHEFGLVHTGKNTLSICVPPGPSPLFCDPATQSLQVTGFGSMDIPDFLVGFGLSQTDDDAMTLFLREFDSGVGPLVGFSHTVDAALFASALDVDQALSDLEQLGVEKAHAGLAVHAWIDGVPRGFYYDVTDAATPYHEEPQSGLARIGPFNRAGLLAFVSDPESADRLMFHFTPLGSERRVARLGGGLAPAFGDFAAPSAITLEASRTMTANDDVPLLTTGWVDLIDCFNFIGSPGSVTQLSKVHFQKSLLGHTAGGFGLTSLHHEAPRRLRVTGTGIRQGARLILWPPAAADVVSGGVPTTEPDPVKNPRFMRLPLYPTRDETGALVWETAVEIEAFHLLAFMNGGDANAPVALAQQDPNNATFVIPDPDNEGCTPSSPAFIYLVESTDIFEPDTWNWWYVEVQNDPRDPATTGSGGWQRLTIE